MTAGLHRIGDLMASTSQLKAAGFAEDEQAALLKIKGAYGVKATKAAIKEEKGSLGFMKYLKSNTHTVRRGHTLDGPSRLPLTLSSTSRPALPCPTPPAAAPRRCTQVKPKTIIVNGKKVTHYVAVSNTFNTLLCKVCGRAAPFPRGLE